MQLRLAYGGSGSPQFSALTADEDRCEKGARLAKFSYFTEQKKVRIVAGQALRLKARTLFKDWRASGEARLWWCESVAEFTPRAGRRYRAWHYQPHSPTGLRRCVLKVVDETDEAVLAGPFSTAIVPPDLAVTDTLPCPPFTVSW